MASIIAYHGWGFDSACWAGWQSKCYQKGHQFQWFDRGYWGNPSSPKFSDDPPYILLLHSFGLHLCPPAIIESADTVAIFNSFLSFHPDDKRLQRRSRRIVQQMGDRFRTHPHDVLQAFWQNCYAPAPWPSSSTSSSGINCQLLQHDLEALNTAALDAQSSTIQAMQQVKRVWVFHGDADQIVPLPQGVTLADAVNANGCIAIPNAGHALPFSHLEHCWTLEPFTTL